MKKKYGEPVSISSFIVLFEYNSGKENVRKNKLSKIILSICLWFDSMKKR